MFALSVGEPTRHQAARRHVNSQTVGPLHGAALRLGSVRTRHTLIYLPRVAAHPNSRSRSRASELSMIAR